MTAQPDFNWGISTLGCHELDLPAICRVAEKHGIHHLEVRSLADCLNLPEYLDITYPNDPDAVQRVLDQPRQSIIALNSGFKLIDADNEARPELLGAEPQLVFPVLSDGEHIFVGKPVLTGKCLT